MYTVFQVFALLLLHWKTVRGRGEEELRLSFSLDGRSRKSGQEELCHDPCGKECNVSSECEAESGLICFDKGKESDRFNSNDKKCDCRGYFSKGARWNPMEPQSQDALFRGRKAGCYQENLGAACGKVNFSGILVHTRCGNDGQYCDQPSADWGTNWGTCEKVKTHGEHCYKSPSCDIGKGLVCYDASKTGSAGYEGVNRSCICRWNSSGNVSWVKQSDIDDEAQNVSYFFFRLRGFTERCFLNGDTGDQQCNVSEYSSFTMRPMCGFGSYCDTSDHKCKPVKTHGKDCVLPGPGNTDGDYPQCDNTKGLHCYNMSDQNNHQNAQCWCIKEHDHDGDTQWLSKEDIQASAFYRLRGLQAGCYSVRVGGRCHEDEGLVDGVHEENGVKVYTMCGKGMYCDLNTKTCEELKTHTHQCLKHEECHTEMGFGCYDEVCKCINGATIFHEDGPICRGQDKGDECGEKKLDTSVAYKGYGEALLAEMYCGYDLYCYKKGTNAYGNCHQISDKGEECSSNRGCQSHKGLMCEQNTCQCLEGTEYLTKAELTKVGSFYSHFEYDEGCFGTKEQETCGIVEMGSDPTLHIQCGILTDTDLGLNCVDGKCVKLLYHNETCTKTEECHYDKGLVCKETTQMGTSDIESKCDCHAGEWKSGNATNKSGCYSNDVCGDELFEVNGQRVHVFVGCQDPTLVCAYTMQSDGETSVGHCVQGTETDVHDGNSSINIKIGSKSGLSFTMRCTPVFQIFKKTNTHDEMIADATNVKVKCKYNSQGQATAFFFGEEITTVSIEDLCTSACGYQLEFCSKDNDGNWELNTDMCQH